jgi:tetratricopeptide (TPR) repeat protein
LAYGLYLADSAAAARALYERILADRPDDLDALGQLGVIAARQKDRAGAAGADQRLVGVTRPYLFGAHTYRRARIAAQLGERARAVQLLREALAQGYRRNWTTLTLHSDPDLEPLRGYAPFEEFMRPKG